MQSPTVKEGRGESRSLLTTPLACPYSVTVRRNPSRKARPTKLQTAVPFPADDVPTVDVLEAEPPPPPRKEISESDSCSGHSQISEDLKVFLRIRPLKGKLGAEKSLSKDGEMRLKKNAWPRPKKEVDVAKDKKLKTSDVSCIVVNDSTSVSVSPPLAQQDSRRIKTEKYEGFSQVFESESSQEQVYDRMMKPLVEDFMKGKSGMLVAMGPSGSGKTHTVFGCPRDPGMVPLALRQIFQPNGNGHSTPSRSFHITVFEITSEWGKGEKILDLLSDGADISIYQSTIKGLQEVVISDVAHAESIIACAMLKRSTAMTKANSQSSRSQCVINLHLANEKAEGLSRTLSTSAVLTIIDLAGAERSKRTGLQGKRLGESGFINNTSMIFGLCLRSLFEHQKNPKKQLQRHFQSSLLTRYLRDYLEGKKRMSLILTVKSEEEDYNDTSFVLRQASPFMQIKFACTPQPNLLGAKRNSQALARSDQAKKVKFSHLTGPKADREGCETETDHHLDEEGAVISVEKIKESLPQTARAQSVDVEKKEKNEDSPYKLQRSSHIMLNIAKGAWNVLKEYKSKLQDAVNEINNLKEILDFEKTRRLELEEEIQYLKSNCSCSKKNSAESDLVKVDAYLEFGADRSQNNVDITSTAEEADPTNNLTCEASQFADSERENDFSQGNNLKACLQERSGTRGHYSSCFVDSTRDDKQVTTSFLSPAVTEPEENGNCQQSDALGRTSAVKDGCCYLLGASHDKHDQKTESAPVLDESNENVQLSCACVPTSVVCDEPCSLPEKPQKRHDMKTDSIPDCMRNGKDIEKSCEFLKSAISPHSSINVKGVSPQSKSSSSVLDIGENKDILSNKLMKQEDCLSDSKPKRRLMPASTILLRDMRVLDYGDEVDQRSKGNRGRKKVDTEENQRTQGSINLLRLLKSNLHR